MNVNPVSGGIVSKNYPTVRREIPAEATPASGGPDTVELSGQTQGASSGIRADKVAAVKAAIANGTYETDDKIDATVNKLLDQVT